MSASLVIAPCISIPDAHVAVLQAARPSWNDDPYVDEYREEDRPPVRQSYAEPRAAQPRVSSGRRAGMPREPPAGYGYEEPDPEHVARAAPKLTLLKSKIARSRSRPIDAEEEDGYR